jgi:uncharacterized protein (TIGR00369 family)
VTDQENVPQGFEPLPEGLGFTDSLQPIYRCVAEDSVSFGLHVAAHHSNSLGICHGGVLMSLADITAASGVNLVAGKLFGNPTVNLAVDFINGARQGEWIEGRVDKVSVKRRFGFSSGGIYSGEKIIARFNGTFYLPDHDGMVQQGAAGDGVLQGLES